MAEKIESHQAGPGHRRQAKKAVTKARRRFEKRFMLTELLYSGKMSDTRFFVRGWVS